MARHTFIQETKLRDVQGRIGYITSTEKQEFLYAYYDTAEPIDDEYWKKLAEENQKEFRKSGTEGRCIEARELIIALPENYTEYDPKTVLKEFTDAFKKEYGVECISALHHNKTKTNYHIHLIFSERERLPEPEVKIAARNMFYDETGKKVRTKKEITDENGNIRPGCTIVKKGEIYEQHLFRIKDPRFKGKEFLAEVKAFYTDLINLHIKEPEKHLKVFTDESVYLPTKKVGKNNPKAAEIKADNAARQEWNQTADVALVSGVPEEKIIEVKREDIQKAAKESVQQKGWLPGLFRAIVYKAKEKLESLILSFKLPPKPVPKVDIDIYNGMVAVYKDITKHSNAVEKLNKEIVSLRQELDRSTGIFKASERKRLNNRIEKAGALRDEHSKAISEIVRKAGYSSTQSFMRAFNQARELVGQYKYELSVWQEDVAAIKAGKTPPKRKVLRPQKESIIEQLTRLKKEAQKQTRQRKVPQRSSRDMER